MLPVELTTGEMEQIMEYSNEYARGYKKFYCIRCGGLNLRSWKN